MTNNGIGPIESWRLIEAGWRMRKCSVINVKEAAAMWREIGEGGERLMKASSASFGESNVAAAIKRRRIIVMSAIESNQPARNGYSIWRLGGGASQWRNLAAYLGNGVALKVAG